MEDWGLTFPVLHQALCLGMEHGNRSERVNKRRVLTEGLTPEIGFGDESSDRHHVRTHSTQKAKRRPGRRPGRHDVVDNGHPPPGHRRDALAIKEEPLVDRGRDRAHRLRLRVTEVNLRGLVQDDVLVQSERSRNLEGDGDAHRGDGRDHFDVEGSKQVGQVAAGLFHKTHALIHRDEKRESQLVAQGDEGEIDPLGSNVDGVNVILHEAGAY